MNLEKGIHQEVIEAKINKDSNAPIKTRVNTFPLNSGGANFKTHKLVKNSLSKVSFKPTVLVILFCLCFFIIGLGVFSYSLFGTAFPEDSKWLVSLFGVVFTLIGVLLFYFFTKPRVFNKTINLYYKSFTSKNVSKSKHSKSLSDIVAIQIIGEVIQSDNSSYNSFELNLVLNDASRINVIDHGNLKSIIEDAQYLSEFLNVPIWHASSHLEDYNK